MGTHESTFVEKRCSRDPCERKDVEGTIDASRLLPAYLPALDTLSDSKSMTAKGT